MAVSPVVTRGFGSFGSVNLVPTLGFTSNLVSFKTLLAAVLSRLGNQLGGSYPGGFWTDVAPRGTTMPYIVVTEIGQSSKDMTSTGTRMETGQLQMSLFGTAKTTLRELGDDLMVNLEDAGLTFTEGSLMRFRQDSRIAQNEPARTPGAVPVHQEIRTFEFMYSRTVGVGG